MDQSVAVLGSTSYFERRRWCTVLASLWRFLFDTKIPTFLLCVCVFFFPWRLCSETIHTYCCTEDGELEVQMSSRHGGRWTCRFVRPCDLYCLAFGSSFLFAFFITHTHLSLRRKSSSTL
jgi:hypothetical protein